MNPNVCPIHNHPMQEICQVFSCSMCYEELLHRERKVINQKKQLEDQVFLDEYFRAKDVDHP